MPTTPRRRKRAKAGSKNDAAGTNSSKSMATDNADTTKAKEFPMCQVVTLIVCLVTFPQIAKFTQFGPTSLLGHSWFDLHKSPSEWRALLEQQNKTVLIIGGPHRSGTTLLWKAISAHPDTSSFGTPFHSGVSFSEGVLMQDVYPKFGVATELAIKNQAGYQERMEGVGKFALGDERSVHLLETDERVTADNLARLLNRFGSHWNLTKPVWVDKSPPAAVMSRFLQALYNFNVEDDNEANAGGEEVVRSPTKFLFITRHPIANAYGHHHLLGGSDVVPFDTILRNYMKIHTYLQQDMPHLRNDPMLIKLEDFVTDPRVELMRIFDWLGLDSSPDIIEALLKAVDENGEGIRTDVNDKYREKWCTEVNEYKRDYVAGRFQPTVDQLKLGYDIKGWCKGR